jgi:acetyl esterase/lipase
MASPELETIKARIEADRLRAGFSAEQFDLRAARASVGASDLPLPEGTEIRYVLAGQAGCYWVTAPGADPDRRMLYFHGGGYVAGGFASHRALAAWLSAATGAAVLFVDYRLAPEHRFPAAVDDAAAAHRLVLAAGPDGSAAPPRRVFIAGDSAGGGLAAATILRARADGLPTPDGGILLCAMVDLDEETSTFLKQSQRTRDMVRLYVSALADLANPLAAPILADLAGFPPLLIQTGAEDFCRDENLRFAARAEAAGVAATLEVWPEMIHVWQRFAPKLPEATQALERIGQWIGEVEAQGRPARASAG